MNLKKEPTYLSVEVWKALLLIAKSQCDETRKVTVEDVADTKLRSKIIEDHPGLLEKIQKHYQDGEQMDRELIKNL